MFSGQNIYGLHPLKTQHVTGAVRFLAHDSFARVEGLVYSDVVLQAVLASHAIDRCGGQMTFLENEL